MILNPHIGHFPVGQGYIYTGELYPSHAGMTSLEVYCRALGITLPDGTIPGDGVVYHLNHNLVPYNLSESDSPRDINMNGFKITNVGVGTIATDAATVGFVQDFYQSGVSLGEIGNPNDLLLVSLDGNSIIGASINSVFPEKTIFEAMHYSGVI